MSIIPKSPSENSEQKKAPSVPQKTRGLFPRDDGWYDVDENGGEKKLATMDDIPNDNNPSVIKNISISKSEDYTNLSIEKKDGTTSDEAFYNKNQADTKFAEKSSIPDITELTKKVADIEKKKVSISDVVDDLNTNDSTKLLSANMGAFLYSKIPTAISQLHNDLNFLDAIGVLSEIYNHNVDVDSHNDIRLALQQVSNRLSTFLDTDNTTLDQVSEIVAYIDSNKDLIDTITTSKVNVSDIIDNLTTNVSDKPLSAAQGVQIKQLLDELHSAVQSIPTNISQLGYVKDSKYVHTDNNFTNEYKEKIDSLGDNPGGSGSSGITHSWNGTVLTITSDSGTSSADLKGEKGDPPNIVFHYDEETGNLYYKVDGALVDGEYVATNNLVSKEYLESYVNESILGGAW